GATWEASCGGDALHSPFRRTSVRHLITQTNGLTPIACSALLARSTFRSDDSSETANAEHHDMTPAQALPAVLDKIDADLDQSLERLFEFLRIQSISTDPAYKDQCQSAAEYVARDLCGTGLKNRVRRTE